MVDLVMSIYAYLNYVGYSQPSETVLRKVVLDIKILHTLFFFFFSQQTQGASMLNFSSCRLCLSVCMCSLAERIGISNSLRGRKSET